jgi:hypothetical protein
MRSMTSTGRLVAAGGLRRAGQQAHNEPREGRGQQPREGGGREARSAHARARLGCLRRRRQGDSNARTLNQRPAPAEHHPLRSRVCARELGRWGMPACLPSARFGPCRTPLALISGPWATDWRGAAGWGAAQLLHGRKGCCERIGSRTLPLAATTPVATTPAGCHHTCHMCVRFAYVYNTTRISQSWCGHT